VLHLFQRRIHERFRNGGPSIVYQDIQFAQRGDGIFDPSADGLRVYRIRLDCNAFSARRFNRLDYGGS